MIPPAVMYVLGAVLVLFGAYRVSLGRKPGGRNRTTHLLFGGLYVLMGLFLILTTAGVIPYPRIGGPPTGREATPRSEVDLSPVGPIEVRAIPTLPGAQPMSSPAAPPSPAPPK